MGYAWAMAALFWTDKYTLIPALTVRAKGGIHEWRCPCDDPECKGVVLYCRDMDGGVNFVATQTFEPTEKPLMFHVDNAEDFERFLADEHVPAFDRMMYGLWLLIGLREALLGVTRSNV